MNARQAAKAAFRAEWKPRLANSLVLWALGLLIALALVAGIIIGVAANAPAG